MKVLVACESSGVVRRAFEARGHDAWSCDLLPADDKACKHILTDARNLLKPFYGWDLLIAHPPCTFLTNAGSKHLWDDRENEIKNEQRWCDLEEGAELFKAFLEAPIEKIAVENPIMHKHGKALIGRGQDQCVQPWMFGHMEQKATCLWLK